MQPEPLDLPQAVAVAAAVGGLDRQDVQHRVAAALLDLLRQQDADFGRPVLVPGLDGVGYREVVATLERRLPEARLRDAVVAATRRYAKRQETWFRHQLRRQTSDVRHQSDDVWTIDATAPPEELAAMIHRRWCTTRADV